MIGNYGKEICYAVDDDGQYELVPSLGWEPKNITNEQAWHLIEQEILETVQKIRAGKLSPLAFHMAKNQMDVKLLSQYIELPRWKVKRHLKPHIFNCLKLALIKKYADLFNITVAQLSDIQGELDMHFQPPGETT